MACLAAAEANAADYKMVLCAGNNGSNHFGIATNTASPQNPAGIFQVENYCGPAPDPAGNSAFIRILENQAAGNAGHMAYASASWTAPPWVTIVAGGGWTRQNASFNDGWRARFWAEGQDGSTPHNILMQGAGVSNGGIFWATTSTFAPHLWPFGSRGNYRRFVYEMTCMRPAGCDRSGWNVTDANTFVLILADVSPSQVALTNTGAPLLAGQWVRGTQTATYGWSELGSGMRFERLKIDGADRLVVDHIAEGRCNRDVSPSNGEFARVFQPCPTGSSGRSYAFNTASLADGAHTVQACTQDYAQWQGLSGTGSQSCDQRTIRTDNTAPGAPAQLVVNSANPERYLDRFGATFTLPPNQGSPIVKVHYSVLDAAGKVVVPEKTVNATNPIALTNIEGKKEPGAYRLQVRLEDAVGFIGPAAVAPIPHDTTPPAAPQDLSVTPPMTPRSAQGFDVRWHNILDAGSPIGAVHYRVVSPGGEVVVPATTLAAGNPQAIENLDTPRERGAYLLELWLSDAEQNTGAPVKAPLAYDCVRSEAGGGSGLTAGLGERADGALLVRQGEGSTLRGKLQGLARPASAPVCVFSQVVTDPGRQFLGVAMTDPDGSYQFAIGAGPSRDLTAVYRPGQRELAARATLKTRVRPSFRLVRKVIRNKGFAIFEGAIPGPRSNEVVVVLQVKSGKAWRVFRRYRTREDGRFLVRYRFTQTATPTVYIMRAQVRAQSGYPYEEGNSQARRLRVVPARP